MRKIRFKMSWVSAFVLSAFFIIVSVVWLIEKNFMPHRKESAGNEETRRAFENKTGEFHTSSRTKVRSRNQSSGSIADFVQRLDVAKSLNAEERETAIKAVFYEAASLYPEFVARELEGSGLSHTGMLEVASYLISRWPDGDKAIHWVDQTIRGKERGRLLGMALAECVRSSQGTAISFIESMPKGTQRDDALRIMMDALVKADVSVALGLSKKLGDTEDGSIARSLATSWAAVDLAGLTAYISRSENVDENILIFSKAAAEMKLRKESPEAAFSWAASLPSTMSGATCESVVKSWSSMDPVGVARFLSEGDDKMGGRFPKILAAEWSKIDPSAASAWIAKNDSEYKPAMVVDLMNHWLESSPTEASGWLGTLPEGDARDQGILVLLRRETAGSPSAVVPWIEQLSTPALRDKEWAWLQSIINSDLLQESIK